MAEEQENETGATDASDETTEHTQEHEQVEPDDTHKAQLTIKGYGPEFIAALDSQQELIERITHGIDVSAYAKAIEQIKAAMETATTYYSKALGKDLRIEYEAMLPKMPQTDFMNLFGGISEDAISSITTVANEAFALNARFSTDFINKAFTSIPAMEYYFTLPKGLTEEIAEMGTRLCEQVLKSADVVMQQQRIADSILEALKPQMTRIERILHGVDVDSFWEGFQNGARRWGDHGWVAIMAMPLYQIRECPDDFAEANRIGRHYAKKEMERLRRELPEKARKPRDVEEMFALYDGGHLKACAMITCSLIDGEFMNWAIAKTNNRNTYKKPKHMQPIDELNAAHATYTRLLNVMHAYEYFFKSGNGFDRSREGELNRHFLMHGMMYKNVSKTVCMKLFLLLDGVIDLKPLCKLGDEPNQI